MLDYQQRVVDEKEELDTRIQKLATFFETETFKNLDVAEMDRLGRQFTHIRGYSEVLTERIAAFSKDTSG